MDKDKNRTLQIVQILLHQERHSTFHTPAMCIEYMIYTLLTVMPLSLMGCSCSKQGMFSLTFLSN